MNLKKKRTELNLTQKEVSKELHITTQAYANYEQGLREPNIETLIRLANYYHTSIDYLVGRDTQIINLNTLNGRDKRLIEDILAMNELQKTRAEAYFDGLFQR